MNDLPDAVIRPSGVWNTRAPYHTYLVETSGITRDHALLTLAVSRTRYDAEHLDDASSSNVNTFMRTKVSGQVARKFWTDYRDDWRRRVKQPEGQPAIADVEKDLARSLYAVREAAIISWSSTFETFCQCWALNMVLARLDAGEMLCKREQDLAHELSPIHHTPGRPTPGVPSILRCFESARDGLAALPHINRHPRTGVVVEQPLDPALTALSAVRFWRSYRNLLIHRGGLISREFIDHHRAFFEAFRSNYTEVLRELKPMQRLQLPSMILPALATTHTKAARWLNQLLVEASSGRRGKVRGPEEDEPLEFDSELVPPPLLSDGDHPGSLEWVRNSTLREDVLARVRKALPNKALEPTARN